MDSTKQMRSNSFCVDCGGYNLLMTSIALIVTGIIIVGALQAYTIYKTQQDAMRTQEVVSRAVEKIQTFKETFGRYPCPSSLTAARNTAAYGTEDCTTAIPAGTCVGGICSTTGRTISAVAQPVRTGAIPFRLLQIEEKEVYDAYGSRLIYSMSANQGSTLTFADNIGAIGMRDESGQDLITPADTVDYVVISPGRNKRGGYNSSGNVSIGCVAGDLETRNCIDMTAAPASPTRFASSQAYLGGTANNFDDIIQYFATNVTARWRRTNANPDDIQTITNANVGVGVATPGVALEISQNGGSAAVPGVGDTWQGGVRVTGTKTIAGLPYETGINADKICDETGTNCFRPENFASVAGIATCPAGTYMTGIKGDGTNAIAECKPIRVSCQPPNVLTGLTAAGVPICAAVSTNCTLSNVQICEGSYATFQLKSSNEAGITNPTPTSAKAVPDAGNGIHNVAYYLFDAGSYPLNKARAEFLCSNGNWLKTGNRAGLCSCMPTLPPNNVDCTTTPISPSCFGTGACAGYATGATSIPYTFDAVNCGWVGGVPTIGTCTCPAPGAAPATVACGGGYNTGLQVPGWTWDPNPAVCNWNANPSTCACNPANEVPPTTAGATRPGPGTTLCKNLPGFAGYAGNATEIQRFNATVGACGWYFNSWDTSACTCDPTPFSEVAPSTCNAACQNETVQAKNWYHYGAPGCTKIFDYSDPSTCVAKSFSWQPLASSTPLSGQPGHGPYAKGSACNTNCMVTNTAGELQACWEPDSPSGFKIHSCVCQ